MNLKFPTDRVIFFSDAVFAIAMTLLILEIKLPTMDEYQSIGIAGVLNKRIPNFVGYIISFFVTAMFWKAHVQLCTLVKTVTPRFFWLNVWLLFFVVLMPFSTALYSNYFGDDVAFAFYWFNLATIGFFMVLLTYHVLAMNDHKESFQPKQLRWFKLRAAITPAVFLFCVLLDWMGAPLLGRFGFILIFLLQGIGDFVMRRNKDDQLPAS
jgi:uncharacterized membrane protein